MKRIKGLLHSLLLLLCVGTSLSQPQHTWNHSETAIDSIMIQKGFHFVESGYSIARYYKQYEGNTFIFGIAFLSVVYSWDRTSVPTGEIESISYVRNFVGNTDQTIKTITEQLKLRYGNPAYVVGQDQYYTYLGRPAAVLSFKSGKMFVTFLNSNSLMW